MKTEQDKLKKLPYTTKKIHDKTKHFGSFVGRGNRLRLGLSEYLYRNYQNKTLQTYHTDVTNDYFREHLAVDEMLNHGYSWDEVEQSIEFLKKCPLKLDDITEYPILHETKVYDLIDYYQDIFVDIVNQTYFSGNTFYLDDHLWRSIITKTPFIVQGPQNFLENFNITFSPYQEIETNGTVYIDSLFEYINQINCSPKLSNSGLSENRRIVPTAIKRIMEHSNYQFKFVISTEDDIKEIFATFIMPFGIPLKRIVIMPGLDSQTNFHERTQFVLEMAKKYRFRGLTRLHISAWDKTLNV